LYFAICDLFIICDLFKKGGKDENKIIYPNIDHYVDNFSRLGGTVVGKPDSSGQSDGGQH
jgi:hypothetical protein